MSAARVAAVYAAACVVVLAALGRWSDALTTAGVAVGLFGLAAAFVVILDGAERRADRPNLPGSATCPPRSSGRSRQAAQQATTDSPVANGSEVVEDVSSAGRARPRRPGTRRAPAPAVRIEVPDTAADLIAAWRRLGEPRAGEPWR